MDPRIEIITEKKLVGIRIRMSLSDNNTTALWQRFMSRRREIKNQVSADLYSVQVYDKSLDFKDFTPTTVFEKWAAIEVAELESLPAGMDEYILEGGKYAVFIHKGSASAFYKTFQFIYGDWLPNSKYQLDDRGHFELLGDKYKHEDSTSEEEVWVPIM